MKNLYDDIVNLPHHVSAKHPQMSFLNRAAQFLPFAALTGYEAAIKETARLTDKRIELDEGSIAQLNIKLNLLSDMIDDRPKVSVTYFKQDEKKEGGSYIKVNGKLKRIDNYKKIIVMHNDEKIAVKDVLDIECEVLRFLD